MKSFLRHALGIASLSATIPCAYAVDLYSPPLPATGGQFLECVIVNVSPSSQKVTTQAFDGNGVPASGPYHQVLTAGQMGGFSISASAAATYCKFTGTGAATDYRADINVLDFKPDGTTYIVVALPAQ